MDCKHVTCYRADLCIKDAMSLSCDQVGKLSTFYQYNQLNGNPRLNTRICV